MKRTFVESEGKYLPLSGTRRSRYRSQIVVNDTLGDSGDSRPLRSTIEHGLFLGTRMVAEGIT